MTKNAADERELWISAVMRANGTADLVKGYIYQHLDEWLAIPHHEDDEAAKKEIRRIVFGLLCPRFYPESIKFMEAHRDAILAQLGDEGFSSAFNLAQIVLSPKSKEKDKAIVEMNNARLAILKRIYNDPTLKDFLNPIELQQAQANKLLDTSTMTNQGRVAGESVGTQLQG